MNFENDRPIYVQLVDQLKQYIISGNIKPGDRMLSVREFALMFKVNPNTMQKALNELEEEKLIYTERTNGKYVTKDIELIQNVKKELANVQVKKYLESMKNLGFTKQESINYLERNNK